MASVREQGAKAPNGIENGADNGTNSVTVQTMGAFDAVRFVPTVATDANKYTRGVCDLLVGSDAFPGAAVMVACAANRAGAGYVTAYTTDEAARVLHVVQPSIVAKPLETFLMAEHVSKQGHPRSVIIGSGMDAQNLDCALLCAALQACDCPVVVDGSALAFIAALEGREALCARQALGRVTAVTPHGGEAARLARAAQITTPGQDGECDADQQLAAYACDIADAYGAICVLKGPDTYIAAPAASASAPVASASAVAVSASAPVRRVIKMAEGTAALAKAGTGDVLAGIMGAFLAMSPAVSRDAVRAADVCAAAAFVHARAGRVVADEKGPLCAIPEDIIGAIPAAVQSLGRM